MAFQDREFDTYVVLGSPHKPNLWAWTTWPAIAETLTPLVGVARAQAAVRTTQFEPDGRNTVRFGRIGWNNAGHQKWVHGSPMNGESSRDWRFLDAEMWAPAWTTCERDRLAPELFFAVRNERFHGERELKFNPVVLLAIAADLGPEIEQRAAGAVRSLTAHLDAVLTVRQRRPWGKRIGDRYYTNAINDLLVSGLFRVGRVHGRAADETTFEDSNWTRVDGG
jgi:hypothetical protein